MLPNQKKVVKNNTKRFLALGGLHGDKPCDILQAMALTNDDEKVYRTSSFRNEGDRLGLFSPTHDQRSEQQSGQITLQSVLINKPKFLQATHIQK